MDEHHPAFDARFALCRVKRCAVVENVTMKATAVSFTFCVLMNRTKPRAPATTSA